VTGLVNPNLFSGKAPRDIILCFVFGKMALRNCGSKSLLSIGGRRLALWSFVLLIMAILSLTSRATIDAFCSNPSVLTQKPPTIYSYSSSALGLLRPDWMRRAGRIEEKRKERRGMHESLRKRQAELDIRTTRFGKTAKDKDTTPRMYIVVAPTNNSNSTSYNGTSDNTNESKNRLPIYPFVPEDEVEFNDEYNVLDWLDHGEIVKAIRTKKVNDHSVPPPPMAVVAATMIYSVPTKIQTDILWIEHDRGGWSPTIVDGVKRLIPIDGDANSSNRKN